MTKIAEIYKCEVCGNEVQVTKAGQGELNCCNKPMILQKEFPEISFEEK